MKKIIFTSILTTLFLFSNPHQVNSETNDIYYPEIIDITNEETNFEINLLNDSKTYKIEIPEKIILSSYGEEKEATISLSQNKLNKDNKTIEVTIIHDPLPIGRWTYDLEINCVLQNDSNKVKTTVERKTMYAYKTVNLWDEENYELEPSSQIYQTKTQYGYKEVQYGDSYQLTKPDDVYFIEDVQYGFQTRDKQVVNVPYSYEETTDYNAYGSCPLDCISGSENFYGTGCSCKIRRTRTGEKQETVYGEWMEDENSWRFLTPYQSEETISPITRTVYLIPEEYSQETGWRDEPYEASSNIVPVSRTVYLKPLSYSGESNYSDSKPDKNTNTIIVSKDFCRLKTNDTYSEWSPCE